MQYIRSPELKAAYAKERKAVADDYRAMRKLSPHIARRVWDAYKRTIDNLAEELFNGR